MCVCVFGSGFSPEMCVISSTYVTCVVIEGSSLSGHIPDHDLNSFLSIYYSVCDDDDLSRERRERARPAAERESPWKKMRLRYRGVIF